MRWIRSAVSAGTVSLLLMTLAATQATARVQQAPSSRVAIDLPDGYQPSRLFTGFVNEAAGASLVIVELPEAAYEQLANGLTPEALATKGITDVQAGKIARAQPYIYMTGVQASGQGPVAKFLMAFRNGGVTALITANVQKVTLDQGVLKAEDVERVLASATIAAAAAPAQELFRLAYLGPFKPAGSILGTTRAFTLDGRMEPGAPGEQRAMLVVAPSLDRRPVVDAERQAETLLQGLAGLQAPKVAESRRLRVAGMEAIELVGSATDKDGGAALALWQLLVLPKSGGYYRLVGQMPAAEKDRLVAELRRVAEGFTPVE